MHGFFEVAFNVEIVKKGGYSRYSKSDHERGSQLHLSHKIHS